MLMNFIPRLTGVEVECRVVLQLAVMLCPQQVYGCLGCIALSLEMREPW